MNISKEILSLYLKAYHNDMFFGEKNCNKMFTRKKSFNWFSISAATAAAIGASKLRGPSLDQPIDAKDSKAAGATVQPPAEQVWPLKTVKWGLKERLFGSI